MLLDRQYIAAQNAVNNKSVDLETAGDIAESFAKNFEKAYLKYSVIEVAKKVVIGAALIGIGVFTAKKVL